VTHPLPDGQMLTALLWNDFILNLAIDVYVEK